MFSTFFLFVAAILFIVQALAFAVEIQADRLDMLHFACRMERISAVSGAIAVTICTFVVPFIPAAFLLFFASLALFAPKTW